MARLKGLGWGVVSDRWADKGRLGTWSRSGIVRWQLMDRGEEEALGNKSLHFGMPVICIFFGVRIHHAPLHSLLLYVPLCISPPRISLNHRGPSPLL